MRHADVVYSDADGRPVHPDHVNLTPRGLEQCAAAARVLADAPLDAIVTSGLPRTQQTAGPGGPSYQRVSVFGIRTRRPPVRPFKLVGNAKEAASLEALLRNADPVAARGIV